MHAPRAALPLHSTPCGYLPPAPGVAGSQPGHLPSANARRRFLHSESEFRLFLLQLFASRHILLPANLFVWILVEGES